jgi:hypothetical protein
MEGLKRGGVQGREMEGGGSKVEAGEGICR